ncbi:MAG: hypothetical protein K2X47_06175, partial [Bdellovibrionales bacterium]|nr:hypothetical protein [Bdellovibrionales bacterium]
MGKLKNERTEMFVGHEEITRQALVILSKILEENQAANGAVKPSLDKVGITKILNHNFYDEVIVSGAISENPIIQGNYGTDMPADAKYPAMNEKMRVENVGKGVFGATGKHAARFSSMVNIPFFYDKAGKKMALKNLSDQAAFFVKVGFDTLEARLRESMLKNKGKVNPQKATEDYRDKLLLELEKLAIAWGGDWHNNPEGQILHFLRNYQNTTSAGEIQSYGLSTAANTCLSAREMILQITKNALLKYPQYLEALAKKDPSAPEMLTQVLFLIGHATHMLQDSFSGEHTRRALQGMRNFGDTEENVLALMNKKTALEKLVSEYNNDIVDICFYGAAQNEGLEKETPGGSNSCYHKYLAPDAATVKVILNSSMKGDFGDSIWTYGERQETSLLNKLGFRLFSSPKNQSDALAKSRRDNVYNRTTNWDGPELVTQRKATDFSEPTGSERWSLMNHNARLARSATVKYLYAVMTYIKSLNDVYESGKVRNASQLSEAIRNDGGLLKEIMSSYLFETDVVARPGTTPTNAILAALKGNPWQDTALKIPTEVYDADKDGNRERIKINGEMIPEQEIVEFVAQY